MAQKYERIDMNYKEQLEQYNKDVKAQVGAWIQLNDLTGWWIGGLVVYNGMANFNLRTDCEIPYLKVVELHKNLKPLILSLEGRYDNVIVLDFQGVKLPSDLVLPAPPLPPPDRYVYVVCERFQEYQLWCKDNDMSGHSSRKAIYVWQAASLQDGLVENWEVVLVGNWKKRIDLENIRNRLVTLGFKNIPDELMPREITKAAAIAANVYRDDYRVFPSYDYMEFWDSLSDVRRQNVINALKELPDYKKDF